MHRHVRLNEANRTHRTVVFEIYRLRNFEPSVMITVTTATTVVYIIIRQRRRELTAFSVRCFATGGAIGFCLVVDHIACSVKLEVAALEQHVFEHLSSSLNS